MVYITGDIHGSSIRIYEFAKRHKLTKKDVIIILGDVGANYYGDERDERTKENLSKVKARILCIHGNHEMRPESISSYKEILWRGGIVYVEEEFPNLLFAKDGEVYDLNGKKAIAIGGAYSADKFYRLSKGMKWFADEQP